MGKYLRNRLIVIPIILLVFGGWYLLGRLGFKVNVVYVSIVLIAVWVFLLMIEKRSGK